ncbi:MAG: Leucyl aminopeptidase [Frankiales bacterium]|nr:Leucyl aminopeptidase [Frankiales bacterium]
MAQLPALTLAGTVPAAAVLALPTRPGDDRATVLAQPPVDVTSLLDRDKAKGEAGELIALPTEERVLLLGTGDGGPAALRKAGAAIARRAKSQESLALDLRRMTLTGEGLHALAEGLLLGTYGFTVKPSAEPRPLTRITVVVAKPETLADALARAVTVTRAVASARDLVNVPPAEKSPQWLAAQAKSLLKGLAVSVRDDAQLTADGWGGVLAVGMGSSRPPRVVEASVDNRVGGKGKHVVLVGKGITFDTGGISIKTNDGMLTMKCDMGGAAAVLATLRAVADLKLPIKLTVLACAAENMPSGSAQRPSDVITQFGGTTVEVLNTDAEGRLVLADGIAYADTVLDADVIVDIATLTGAMPVALGRKTAGLFSNDDDLSEQLESAAAASGERVWRMPLTDDYRQALESGTADLRNIGDPRLKLNGGSIVAALFLQEFAGGRPWAHLDIAGPGWSGGEDEELTKGGTGYGVRLLTTWLEQLAVAPTRKRSRAS